MKLLVVTLVFLLAGCQCDPEVLIGVPMLDGGSAGGIGGGIAGGGSAGGSSGGASAGGASAGGASAGGASAGGASAGGASAGGASAGGASAGGASAGGASGGLAAGGGAAGGTTGGGAAGGGAAPAVDLLDCPPWFDGGCAPWRTAGPQRLICSGDYNTPSIAALGGERWAIACLPRTGSQQVIPTVTIVDRDGQALVTRQLLTADGYGGSLIKLRATDQRLQVLYQYNCFDATTLTPGGFNQCLEFTELEADGGVATAPIHFGVPNSNYGATVESMGSHLGLAWFNYNQVYFARLDGQRQWSPRQTSLQFRSTAQQGNGEHAQLVWNGTGWGLFSVYSDNTLTFSAWSADGTTNRVTQRVLGSAGFQYQLQPTFSAVYGDQAYFVAYPSGLYGHDLVVEKYSDTGALLASRTLQGDRYLWPTLLHHGSEYLVFSADGLHRGIVRAFDANLNPVMAKSGLLAPGSAAFEITTVALDPATGSLGVATRNNGNIVFRRLVPTPPTSVCGDAIVSPSETCDTALVAGAGRCPIGCDDLDPCSVDTLVNGNTCQARCQHTRITATNAGDQCCPSGATPRLDSDCRATSISPPFTVWNDQSRGDGLAPGAGQLFWVRSKFDSETDAGVRGAILQMDGGITYTSLLVPSAATDDSAVAFDGTNFVVAGGREVALQRVSPTGVLVGPRLTIAPDLKFPRLATLGGQVLLTGLPRSTTLLPVRAQRIAADGGVSHEMIFGDRSGYGSWLIWGVDHDDSSWGLGYTQPAGLFTTITPPTTADTVFQLLDERALRRAPAVLVAHDDLGDRDAPSVAYAQGSWLIGYCERRGAQMNAYPMVRAITSQGEPLAPVSLSSATLDAFTGCPQASWDGRAFIVVWSELRRRVLGQRFSTTGAPLGVPFIINEAPQNLRVSSGRPVSAGGRTLVPLSREVNGDVMEAVFVDP